MLLLLYCSCPEDLLNKTYSFKKRVVKSKSLGVSGTLKTQTPLAGGISQSLMLKPPAYKGCLAVHNTFHVQQLRSLSTSGIPLFFHNIVLLCMWPHQLINSTDTCLYLLFSLVAFLLDMSLELMSDIA